jgi:hypothetical protein
MMLPVTIPTYSDAGQTKPLRLPFFDQFGVTHCQYERSLFGASDASAHPSQTEAIPPVCWAPGRSPKMCLLNPKKRTWVAQASSR